MRYDRLIFKFYTIINVLILNQFTQKRLTLKVSRMCLITSVKSVNIRTCFQKLVVFWWLLKIFELRNYEMFHSANGIKREVQSFNTVALSLYLLFRYHNISTVFFLILNCWSLQFFLFQKLLRFTYLFSWETESVQRYVPSVLEGKWLPIVVFIIWTNVGKEVQKK